MTRFEYQTSKPYEIFLNIIGGIIILSFFICCGLSVYFSILTCAALTASIIIKLLMVTFVSIIYFIAMFILSLHIITFIGYLIDEYILEKIFKVTGA
jgi:hypothetical protein